MDELRERLKAAATLATSRTRDTGGDSPPVNATIAQVVTQRHGCIGEPPIIAPTPDHNPIANTAGANFTGRRKRDPTAVADNRDEACLERIRQVMRAVGDVVYEWTIGDDTIQWGENITDILPVHDVRTIAHGRGFAALLDPENMSSRFDAVMNSGKVDEGSGVPFQVEYRVQPHGRNGNIACWIEDTGRWFAGSDGRPVKVYGVIRNIDKRHEHEQRMAYLSNYDPLTGNMNRARITDALSDALNRADRYKMPGVFLLAAVDNLAMVNDAYGFDVADQVIAAVSKRLKSMLRGGDSIGRYAGNKFGLILSNCSDQDMDVAARRFLEVVRAPVVETGAGPVSATVSIGGVVMPKDANNAQQAMVRAEEALAVAKIRHRDTFVHYVHSDSRESIRKHNVAVADEIVTALNDRRLALAYQPIVRSDNGTPAHYECLLRMIRPDGEIVSAGYVIPVAEKLGLVRLVDHRVLELTVAAAEECPEAKLSFNISGATVADPAWLANLTAFISVHQNVASRLTVEITETVAIHDIRETITFVDNLHDLGCKVAIDDFGAGYTSFKNLKLLDVDMVKIDGSFVENLRDNPDNQFFVRTLIDLAKNFNLKTVAEWVEDERDAAMLRDWGVDYFQGHLYGAATIDKPWLAGAADPPVGSGQPPPAAVKVLP